MSIRTALSASAACASLIAARAWAAPEIISIDAGDVKVVAGGIRGPEGPSELPDGSVALVEFAAGNIAHVSADGTRDNLASLGAGVAGTAVGRDGALYVVKLDTAKFPSLAPSPAAIVRIDLKTRATKTLYTQFNGEDLKGPDDLAIDAYGDLWFTDLTDKVVYWARTDGSAIQPLITEVPGVNGITLSPDHRTLYIVSEGKLLAYSIAGRGKLKQSQGRAQSRVVAMLEPGLHEPDGMKTEANGDILLACWEDGILRYAPDGRFISQTKVPGLQIINMTFGGPDRRTLYLAAHPLNNMVGGLQSIRWPRPGSRLP
jgi:gluconolactonase